MMPELVPESLTDRMSSTVVEGRQTQDLDASSQTRLVLWNAAIDITLESPLLGMGFKAFPALKSSYTAYWVRESDNHNMYLFISSQMGIPALLLFLFILYRMFDQGGLLYRLAADPFARTIGMGGAIMAVAVAGVNMFGTRLIANNVSGYFWIYLAVMSHLMAEFNGRHDLQGTNDTKD